MKNTTLRISSHALCNLRAIAESRGYIQTRGGGAGRGSVSALMEAIGRGEAAVVLIADGPRWALINHLERLAAETEDWRLAEAARATAEQLQEAIRIEQAEEPGY